MVSTQKSKRETGSKQDRQRGSKCMKAANIPEVIARSLRSGRDSWPPPASRFSYPPKLALESPFETAYRPASRRTWQTQVSDTANLSDIFTRRQAGRILPRNSRQSAVDDSPCARDSRRSRPARRPDRRCRGDRCPAHPGERASETNSRQPFGSTTIPAARCAGVGAGERQGGRRSAVLRRREPSSARRPFARRSARRRSSAPAPCASERRGLGKNLAA
jgi:hypothetical protein